ncbi:hypothetical protein DSO10_04680 [Listeria monocytogenes]|uniref:hypothetical protein n=1 Tax=Listeria monocytogenes TaxID=1639 RepID=UPI000F21139B|nr:hypothetical protein [Listeria monocytogenes]EAD0738616.1 hypothetical protein [Listeria monocytogenes]MCN73796.1 hypothetical protein [Listeria monocytogenes]TYU88954.1 hypothetical protein FZX01_05445 [Listeria monocytogenes]
MNDRIIFYSKKNGINQWLSISGASLSGIEKVFDMEQFKEHKPFAYALIDGVEIKLFTDQEEKSIS